MSQTGGFGLFEDMATQPTQRFPIAVDVDHVKVKSVEFDPNGNYGPQLSFTLERNANGAISTLRDWRTVPVKGKVKQRDGESQEAAFEREQKDFNAVLIHYAKMVGDVQEIAQEIGRVQGSIDIGKEFSKVLNQHLSQDGCPALYAKTFQGKKGYATLSKFPPFLQRMSEGECKLEYSKWEEEQNAQEVEPPKSGINETAEEPEVEGEALDFLS